MQLHCSIKYIAVKTSAEHAIKKFCLPTANELGSLHIFPAGFIGCSSLKTFQSRSGLVLTSCRSISAKTGTLLYVLWLLFQCRTESKHALGMKISSAATSWPIRALIRDPRCASIGTRTRMMPSVCFPPTSGIPPTLLFVASFFSSSFVVASCVFL